MKRTLAAAAAATVLGLLPGKKALACEGCVSASLTQPTLVSCITSPDGPGEICTAGGGYCYEEGKCKIQMTGDGSLEQDGKYAAAEASENSVLRRECDQAIVARSYAPAVAQHLRDSSRSLTI